MIEIIIVAITLLVVFMAKHKRTGRRRTRLWVPRIAETIPAGALALKDMTSADFSTLLDREVYAISADVMITRTGFTSNDGPIIFGLSHSDYTSAEIEEWFEAQGSWQQGNQISNERASRKCRMIGTIKDPDADIVWNDGKAKRVKLGWVLQEGQTL